MIWRLAVFVVIDAVVVFIMEGNGCNVKSCFANGKAEAGMKDG